MNRKPDQINAPRIQYSGFVAFGERKSRRSLAGRVLKVIPDASNVAFLEIWPDQARALSISNWRVIGKGALVASFTVTLPSGMIVNEIKLFAKNGKRWLGMPSRKFTTSENTEAYAPLIQFIDRAAADLFRDSVIGLIDELVVPAAKSAAKTKAVIDDEDIPF